MKVACCQLDIAWEDKPANYEKVRRLLANARLPGGSLVVLPEMFATGFSMNAGAISEGIPSPTENFLQRTATEYDVFLLAGLAAVGADGKPRNQALAVSPAGQTLVRYSKIHPFTLGGEAERYVAGTEVHTFAWQRATVAPLICYDLRFPEVFRTAIERGAEILPVMANWPVKREMHWVTLLQARAIENQAYVIGVNRCGTDPKFSYSGRSMIIDPHGTILVDLDNKEGLISADVDLAALHEWRRDFPALVDKHWRS